MRCPQCQYENLSDAAFCQECGAKLQNLCPQCQTENLPTAKFCRKCGTRLTPQSKVQGPKSQVESSLDSRPWTLDPRPISYTPKHLAERILAEQAAIEARGSAAGERKTITALFADIKGSMELIEDLDPEEARHIVDPALQLMMEVVHRYEGYVAQSTTSLTLDARHEIDPRR